MLEAPDLGGRDLAPKSRQPVVPAPLVIQRGIRPLVTLFDESHAFREEARRWLYTGITRAAERVTIVEPS